MMSCQDEVRVIFTDFQYLTFGPCFVRFRRELLPASFTRFDLNTKTLDLLGESALSPDLHLTSPAAMFETLVVPVTRLAD